MKLLRPLKRACKFTLRHLRRIITVGVVSVILLGGVAIYIGRNGAEVVECNYLQLPEEALPGTGPLRIAYVCDIHNDADKLRQAIAHIKEAKPDLILLGGDYVTASQRFMRTRWMVQGLRELAEIAPLFAALGNHDYEKLGQLERVMQTAEITLLRNEARNWETPAGGTVCIVGLGDWNEGDEDPHTCMLPIGEEESAVLVLSHDPESRWFLRQYDWDLMLSGHTHGGQIANPFTNPVQYISLRSSMPAGLFDFEGDRRVFVSRGAGSIASMRFFCPPEINIIDIGDRANFVPPADEETEENEATETNSAAEEPAEDTPEEEAPEAPEQPQPTGDNLIPELPAI